MTLTEQEERFYTVEEAFKILYQEGITASVQGVRRFLRRGDLKGIPPGSRKEGWKIREEDLKRFIKERKSQDFQAKLIDDLKKRIAALEKENKQLRAALELATMRGSKQG